jgi:hypothetical protein
MMVEAYPLAWPDGWPRTASHRRENDKRTAARRPRAIKGDEVMEREETYVDLDGRVKTYADFDELVRLAALDDRPDDDATYSELGSRDLMLLIMGSKLLEGKPFGVTTDDPESWRRSIAFARHIGATVEMIQPGGLMKAIIDATADLGKDEFTQIIFRPPSTQ